MRRCHPSFQLSLAFGSRGVVAPDVSLYLGLLVWGISEITAGKIQEYRIHRHREAIAKRSKPPGRAPCIRNL